VRRREGESKVYGAHACRAVFARRPDDVLKVFLTEERAPHFGDLMKYCAQQRRPYRIVPEHDLEKLTESRHHEGICLLARTAPVPELPELFGRPGPACILALVDVGNPHNVGAILRSAAHFGARGVIMPGAQARLSAAAARTAQGGAEWLDIVHEPDLHRILTTARGAGFAVAATGSRQGRDLYATALPPRLLILLGSEDQGLPPEILEAAEEVLSVPGTGHVESLNVAAATAVLLGEFWRQHHRSAGKTVAAAGKGAARGGGPRSPERQ
jgi:RNA methyltransferase, TrmH family